jgi:hypothetical protein
MKAEQPMSRVGTRLKLRLSRKKFGIAVYENRLECPRIAWESLVGGGSYMQVMKEENQQRSSALRTKMDDGKCRQMNSEIRQKCE